MSPPTKKNAKQSNVVKPRMAGVLLHISSLPSVFGVGDIGAEAKRFIDVLQQMQVRVWQTLPINMPHADNSPYQCLSAHAGNPDFISLETLVADGLLSASDLQFFQQPDLTDEAAVCHKRSLINQAYRNIASSHLNQSFIDFCREQAHWLDDFALFLALRQHFNQAGWQYWPEAYKNRDAATLAQARQDLATPIAQIQFAQYLFFSQWTALKAYATSKNVQLFGDIPIFVAFDSADVWAEPHLFKLDADKNMTVVAGVPPDYFCATGQRWGNPHYDWQVMAADGFGWWVARMTTQSALFDMVRIDHFRGLEAAWEIPATEETAMNGAWAEAPGDALLAAIKKALPNVILIAEDLGIITPAVDALRLKYAMPGMKILQFAFSGEQDNPYLPHNIDENSVVYTGTHDNDTTVGWYNALSDNDRQHVQAYLSQLHGENYAPNMPNDLINIALQTKGYLAIVPMQDVLGLDATHRMNTPGTTEVNWHWRFAWHQLDAEHISFITQSIQNAQRNESCSK